MVYLGRPYHFKFFKDSFTNFTWSILEYLGPYFDKTFMRPLLTYFILLLTHYRPVFHFYTSSIHIHQKPKVIEISGIEMEHEIC